MSAREKSECERERVGKGGCESVRETEGEVG